MYLKVGNLDDRNLNSRVVIEKADHAFYGIIASIRDNHNGTTTLQFTDNETTYEMDNDERVDVNLSPAELAQIETCRKLDDFLHRLVNAAAPTPQEAGTPSE